jgi:tRNA(Ile)-lysidine synthase
MDKLAEDVGIVLRREIPRGATIVLGLSGGIDSVVLLHVLVRWLRIAPARISAIHVNHQISPRAAYWAAFCRNWCRELGVKLRVAKVDVLRGNSTEAAARAARYAVFSGSGADVLVLAHNRDDQAETLLLQLLRGAGPRGLSAMPVLKPRTSRMPAVLRPLLGTPRAAIEAYAARHRLQWAEDESNQDRSYLRNFLRHDVLPLLESKLPGVRGTLARAARHQAECSELLDVLAADDLGTEHHAGRLPLVLLKGLAPSRARNALRYFLRRNDVVMPEAERLDELLRQAGTARVDARVCVDLGGVELRRFQDALYIVRPLPRLAKSFEVIWNGRSTLPLPQLGGSLRLMRRKGEGIAAAALRSASLRVCIRRGGEMLRPVLAGRQRTVRNLLQEAALPPWQRDRLPFLYLDDELAAVPGLGVDAKFQAGAGRSGLLPVWIVD